MNDHDELVSMNLHCTCGAYRRGKLPLRIAKAILSDWEEQHTGEGHARCLPAVARRARIKAEQEHGEQVRKDNAP